MNFSHATRELGRAESTKSHDASAEKLFRYYRRIKELSEKMSAEEFDGENPPNLFVENCILLLFTSTLTELCMWGGV